MSKEPKVKLETGWKPVFEAKDSDKYMPYPRLMVNKLGEIILATSKEATLTRGVLVGKTPESKSTLEIGQRCEDWEVVGDLTDYEGEVTITFFNHNGREKDYE